MELGAPLSLCLCAYVSSSPMAMTTLVVSVSFAWMDPIILLTLSWRHPVVGPRGVVPIPGRAPSGHKEPRPTKDGPSVPASTTDWVIHATIGEAVVRHMQSVGRGRDDQGCWGCRSAVVPLPMSLGSTESRHAHPQHPQHGETHQVSTSIHHDLRTVMRKTWPWQAVCCDLLPCRWDQYSIQDIGGRGLSRLGGKDDVPSTARGPWCMPRQTLSHHPACAARVQSPGGSYALSTRSPLATPARLVQRLCHTRWTL